LSEAKPIMPPRKNFMGFASLYPSYESTNHHVALTTIGQLFDIRHR